MRQGREATGRSASEGPTPSDQNISAVARLERAVLQTRSTADRLAASITRIAGSGPMIVAHGIWLGGWAAINVNLVPGVEPFDPFPFHLLIILLSVEVIFLTLFVLLNQNRMTLETHKHAHLNLQVDLLAEREMTLILRMLHELSARAGVSDQFSAELQELLKDTNVREIADKLEQALPDRL